MKPRHLALLIVGVTSPLWIPAMAVACAVALVAGLVVGLVTFPFRGPQP